MKARKRWLMLDLPFHERTGSADFLVALLERRFDVERVFVEEMSRAPEIVRERAPDGLFLHQQAMSAEQLVALGIPVVWTPMFDASPRLLDTGVVEMACAGASMIAFSSPLAKFARTWRMRCAETRYWPEPGDAPDFGVGNDRAFLWFRGAIAPEDVAPALREFTGLRLTIKHDPDPSYDGSTRRDGALADRIERVVEGHIPKPEYDALVAGAGLFVAPRRSEGIGMSFLEAMARGSLVLGFDAPTMSDYLVHGETGWLFGNGRRDALDPASVERIRLAAYAAAVAGRARWEAAKSELLDFVDSAPPVQARRDPVGLAVRATALAKRAKRRL